MITNLLEHFKYDNEFLYLTQCVSKWVMCYGFPEIMQATPKLMPFFEMTENLICHLSCVKFVDRDISIVSIVPYDTNTAIWQFKKKKI